MTIETVEMYRVVCDRCGVAADEGRDYYAWHDREGAEDVADASDWLITDDGKHYCDDCCEWNDDDDQRVSKP